MVNIYLAGGLFNAAERLHNLFLAKHLRALGDTVILPQVEALQFFAGGQFDTKAIAQDCREACESSENVYVGCADGADADSGTAIEYGIAITARGEAVMYRTDFRTVPEKEVGVNAMFGLRGTLFIYFPCFFTDLEQAEAYYKDLAQKIHDAVFALQDS